MEQRRILYHRIDAELQLICKSCWVVLEHLGDDGIMIKHLEGGLKVTGPPDSDARTLIMEGLPPEGYWTEAHYRAIEPTSEQWETAIAWTKDHTR